jgi:predicted ABC-type ATPase
MAKNPDGPWVVVITGPVGSGKSTTGWALHDLLIERRIPTALIDMDYLRAAWPVVSPFNHELGYTNFAAIAVHHAALGVRTFVVADVVEEVDQRARYVECVPGADVTIVRLDVPLPVIEARLRRRESAESLQWYLDRAPELIEIQRRKAIGDLIVPVAPEDEPGVIAGRIFAQAGLATRWMLHPAQER